MTKTDSPTMAQDFDVQPSPTSYDLPSKKPGLTDLEQPTSLIVGGLLGLYALKRRDLVGLFAAGVGLGMAYRGAQQNDLLNGGWLKRLLNTGNHQLVPFERQLIIDRPPGETYQFFRHPENLGVYLPHIRDVQIVDDQRTHWRLALTEKIKLEWTAELIEDEPDHFLAWRVCEASDLYHEGWVRFEPLRGGDSTRLTTRIYLMAPGGRAGARMVQWLEELPLRYFSRDLQRLRTVLESESPLHEISP
jgi:uncharacterized membrane protein